MRGKFIVFEGISGTGKETQAKLLKKYLAHKNIAATIVYHPTPELKRILSRWRKERRIDSTTIVYLLLADRNDRVEQIIKPALKRGEWVLSLRSWISALVYQGETPAQRVWISHQFSELEPRPDFLFYFDIDPEIALARINKRHESTGERLGTFETLHHLQEKRNAYEQILPSLPHHRINARLTSNEMQQAVLQQIKL